MLTYCLKFKKNTESFDLKILKTKSVKKIDHQNMLYVVLKNQDL